jgi:hypothetical protein
VCTVGLIELSVFVIVTAWMDVLFGVFNGSWGSVGSDVLAGGL